MVILRHLLRQFVLCCQNHPSAVFSVAITNEKQSIRHFCDHPFGLGYPLTEGSQYHV